MDSMEASDWVTAGFALAALIVSLMSWGSSRTSARASVKAAEAAVISAAAAEKSADAEHEILQLERQDRIDADMQRRVNVWRIHPVTAYTAEFKFLGAEAFHVSFKANVVLETGRRRGDPQGPMYLGDSMTVTAQDHGDWDKRITVSWAESADAGAVRLSKDWVRPG